MSRTQPPAKYAMCPSPRNRSTIFRAASLIDEASIAITVAASLCEAQRARHSAPKAWLNSSQRRNKYVATSAPSTDPQARSSDSQTFLPTKGMDDEKHYRN